jgi:hypothetical protein
MGGRRMIEISTHYFYLLLSLTLLSLIIAIIGTIIGLVALVKTIAAEKSTHTITYKPVDDEIEKANSEYLKNWATKDSTIAKDQEMFEEDLENEMPDFFPDEDDKKVHSF